MFIIRNPLKILLVLLIIVFLASCTGNVKQMPEEERIYMPRDRERIRKTKAGRGILTELFKKSTRKSESKEYTGNANSFLWKASLDVLSNFPLSSVDASVVGATFHNGPRTFNRMSMYDAHVGKRGGMRPIS